MGWGGGEEVKRKSREEKRTLTCDCFRRNEGTETVFRSPTSCSSVQL